jgi:hypothetical protein
MKQSLGNIADQLVGREEAIKTWRSRIVSLPPRQQLAIAPIKRRHLPDLRITRPVRFNSSTPKPASLGFGLGKSPGLSPANFDPKPDFWQNPRIDRFHSANLGTYPKPGFLDF